MHGRIDKSSAPMNLHVAGGIGLLLIGLGALFYYKENLAAACGSPLVFLLVEFLLTLLFPALVVLLWVLLRRAQDAAKRRAEMETVISGINFDALLVVQPDRTIVMCNDSVQRIFGYTPEELLNGKTDALYFDRRTSPGPGKGREVYEALARDGYHIGLATGRRRNGATFPLEIITGTLSGRSGAALLLRDITERVKAEQERRELEAMLLRREKAESLALLAGGVAHDFKNLLAAIATHAYLGLKPNQPPEAARESLKEIKDLSDHAADMCRQMLTYAGKGEFVTQQFDFNEAVRQTHKAVRPLLGPKVAVRMELGPAPLPFVGDMAQVQQVAMNLILNASQAIGEREGSVTIQTSACDGDAAFLRGFQSHEPLALGRYLLLMCADTGCGMDEATRQRIFDPFFTTKPDGHGLGLASVQGIVWKHHGGIQVESIAGKGTTFRVLFPLGSAPTAESIG